MSKNDQSKMPAALLSQKGSRRDFLRNTAVTALASTALAACSIDESAAQAVRNSDADHSGGTMAPNPAPVSPAAAAEAKVAVAAKANAVASSRLCCFSMVIPPEVVTSGPVERAPQTTDRGRYRNPGRM